MTYRLKTSHKALKQKQIDNEGFLFCEICKNTNQLSIHHIVFRGEAPLHDNLHHPNNLIMLCGECHSGFHQKKESRENLVLDRKLWELFPKILLKYNNEKI